MWFSIIQKNSTIRSQLNNVIDCAMKMQENHMGWLQWWFHFSIFLLYLTISWAWLPIEVIWLVFWPGRPRAYDDLYRNNFYELKINISCLDTIMGSVCLLDLHDLLFTSSSVNMMWSLMRPIDQFVIAIVNEIKILLMILLLHGPRLVAEYLCSIK